MKRLVACRCRGLRPLVVRQSERPTQSLLSGYTVVSRNRCHTSSSTDSYAQRQRYKTIPPVSDTIYALSTAAGRAAIANIRISGPACLDIYADLCPDKPFPLPRTATLRRLYHPESGRDGAQVLDSGAIILYFPGPKTATGEDILELHVHGGPAIVRSILHAIPRCTKSRPRRRNTESSPIRHAEPGEFTKRAFYNGRLDLTEAEALGETLAAETDQQRRLAVTGMQSGLAKRYEEWRTMLLHSRAELEALIDFSEDQHFDESPAQFMRSVTEQVVALQRQIELHIINASKGELLRHGISIALLGAPNAGKSSLLNRIVGREAAIVSAEEGTTRDIVDVTVNIKGWLCRLGDMAGLRPQSRRTVTERASTAIGLVEQEGIRRARERALQSDVVIVLLEPEVIEDQAPNLAVNREVVGTARECLDAGKTVLFVVNKIDLLPAPESVAWETLPVDLWRKISTIWPHAVFGQYFMISCKDVDTLSSRERDPGGIQAFLSGLASSFADLTSAVTDEDSIDMSPTEAQAYWTASLSVTHRQSEFLKECLGHLHDFLAKSRPTIAMTETPPHHVDGHDDLIHEVINDEAEVDIVTAAEHLRYAAICLAKITGRGDGGDVEDVLGVVFEK